MIASTMLGFGLDIYDVFALPFVFDAIGRSMGLPLGRVALLATVTLLGTVTGGIFFGWWGDGIGRKATLQYTLLLIGLGSLATACAWDRWSLLVLRFVTGIGLGGE